MPREIRPNLSKYLEIPWQVGQNLGKSMEFPGNIWANPTKLWPGHTRPSLRKSFEIDLGQIWYTHRNTMKRFGKSDQTSANPGMINLDKPDATLANSATLANPWKYHHEVSMAWSDLVRYLLRIRQDWIKSCPNIAKIRPKTHQSSLKLHQTGVERA